MNIVEDKSINDEDFSGIIGITDLSGKFVNPYRLGKSRLKRLAILTLSVLMFGAKLNGIHLVLTATTQKYRNKRTICNNWQKLCQLLLIFC